MKRLIVVLLFPGAVRLCAQGIKLQASGKWTMVKTTAAIKKPASQLLRPLQVPANFYTQRLGFFCRQELKMQNAHIPVTFRLGSMENCNYLEQKNVPVR